MSRFKNVVKTSEDMKDKMNPAYVMSIRDTMDLIDHYDDMIKLVFAVFRIGYLQGGKAERAKGKKVLQHE